MSVAESLVQRLHAMIATGRAAGLTPMELALDESYLLWLVLEGVDSLGPDKSEASFDERLEKAKEGGMFMGIPYVFREPPGVGVVFG